jgi:hypothetical protein
MPYSHEDHPFKLKHGFVAWATALLLVMFGYNTVIPLISAVDASVEQQLLKAAPITLEPPVIEENALMATEEPAAEDVLLEETLEIPVELENQGKPTADLPTITP